MGFNGKFRGRGPRGRKNIRNDEWSLAISKTERKDKNGFIFFKAHFSPLPGARKFHYEAVLPELTQKLQEMVRRGQLILSGRYPSSLGGIWIFKAKNRQEAEKLVQENPAVKCNLLTYVLCELFEPLGQLTQYDAQVIKEEPIATPPSPQVIAPQKAETVISQTTERADSFNHSL